MSAKNELRPSLHHVTMKTSRLDEMIKWYALVVGTQVLFRNETAAWTTNDDANQSKLWGSSHVFSRKLPVGKVVTLQLNKVAFRVLIVNRHCHPVIEGECRLDASLSQAIIRRH